MLNEELGHLFGLFRPRILADLSAIGLPTSFIGACLNWYNPMAETYLLHVDEWKQLLARGASYRQYFPKAFLEVGLLRETSFGSVVIDHEHRWMVRYVHAIVNLFYKAHAPARKETDWDDVKRRLSAPPELSLTRGDVRRLRSALRRIDALPDLDGLGSYGPGITSEGLSPFDRWNREGWIPPVPPTWYRWSVRDDYEPKVNYGMRVTRIAEVPKTLKSNRIISSEPGQSMFAQKAVSAYLDMQLHRAFAGHVSLHDQSRHNRLLYDPDYRTIDLSDASDYVSCDLVSSVLPTLWPLLASVRSTHACFPDGEEVPLRTFAPMGSGVCFPILTAVNLAIGTVVCRHPFSVYGDDGIFHKDDILRVAEWMTACGLHINQGKTCYAGPFRESCGLELYADMDITPVYVRDLPHQSDWAKLNELIQKLDELGWSRTASLVVELGVRSTPRCRYNTSLQRREILVPVRIRADRERKLDGYAGLRKWYLTRSNECNGADSVVRTVKGRTKLVYRYRPEQDYPSLMEYLEQVLP